MLKRFDHSEIEKKWQTEWEKNDLYKTDDTSEKPKAFVLDMFPYPSGEGLHVGHPKGYIATDVYSRFKKMNGFEVLHPMGWDAFGLPAENFAIKHKVHPREAVLRNIANFKAQLAHLGFNYDWSREINTTDPSYYKWTQWIFLKLLEKGLAYESFEPINWCPSCQTGLANEDLESDGTCERCGSIVEKKPMRQWVLRITDYADRMLADLDTLTEWPQHIKEAQRNWIGRSEGAEFTFKLTSGDSVTVFTTRPDTLYGVTYLVLAPEHELVQKLKASITNWEDVDAYIKNASQKAEMERTKVEKDKTGVQLQGLNAVHPATGEMIPVFIADYVLKGYGHGAIMAVPAHDERDFAFAKNNELQIIQVINPPKIFERNVGPGESMVTKQRTEIEFSLPYCDEGILMNSGEFDDISSEDAKKAITEKFGGKLVSTYRLNDWVFSRQRYWGEPIPVVHCEACGVVPVPYEQLPVILPDVEHYEPTGTGESPLAGIDSWVNVPCPKCAAPAKRETNTMPQWAGSSWYYLRFIDPKNSATLIDPEKEKKWAPVDVYVGGDHAVRHLIYARFWHKFLYDLGVVHTIEPFTRLEFLGFILAEDGRKMSKRWGNIINPDDVVARHGADTLRVYEMFMGPFENTIAWSTDGLVGAQRFLERVYGLHDHVTESESEESTRLLHKTISKVTEDIEAFKFNTAISAMMIFINHAEKQGIQEESYKAFIKILSPFAPHITEELWNTYIDQTSIHNTEWPIADPTLAKETEVTIAVQINGKLRGTISVSPDAHEDEVTSQINASEELRSKITGDIKKVIYVPGRIINFIVAENVT